MKKQLIIIGVTVLLIVVGLSGCFENEKTNNSITAIDENKLVGTWGWSSNLSENTYPQMIHVLRFSFFENDTVCYNMTDIYLDPFEINSNYCWYSYEIKGDELCFSSISSDCLSMGCGKCSFNENYTCLNFHDRNDPEKFQTYVKVNDESDESKFIGYWKSVNNLIYLNNASEPRNYTYYYFFFENGSFMRQTVYTYPESSGIYTSGYNFGNWTIKNKIMFNTYDKWSSIYFCYYEFLNETTLKLINPYNLSDYPIDYQIFTKYNSAWECFES